MTTDTEREARRQQLDQLIGPFPPEIRDAWTDYVSVAAGELVWQRDGLSPTMRSVTTIAILTARQLPVELLMHSAVYAGVPAANEGLRLAREVFDEIDAQG